jgi:hypothetical protein
MATHCGRSRNEVNAGQILISVEIRINGKGATLIYEE